MLSVWPNLFYFQLAAPLLLRLALSIGMFEIHYHYWHQAPGKRSIVAALAGLVGLLILIGLFVQPAALGAAIILVYFITKKSYAAKELLPYLAIALSLLVLGPGFLAFDWPL